MDAKDKIIVALDVDSLEKAKPLIETLAPYVGCFKIGLELITAVGAPQAIECVHSYGGKLFFDGKFDDIPNTVGAASKVVSSMGVKIFNVHASAGVEAMKAAAANKAQSLLLAVTILTAIDETSAQKIFGAPVQDKVLQFALEAKQAGCDGIVCSPQELDLISQRKELAGFLKVTPGVRPLWAEKGDQKRTQTPIDAIRAGASYLVIGRPITQPPSEIGTPVAAAKRIADEIAAVL